MTLLELSPSYHSSADALRTRMAQLRKAARTEGDPEEAERLRCRIAALDPLVREMRELAALTAHYYERGYYRNAKYTV